MTFLFRKHGRYGCKCVRGHPSRDVSAYGLAHPPSLWDQLPSGICQLFGLRPQIDVYLFKFPSLVKKGHS